VNFTLANKMKALRITTFLLCIMIVSCEQSKNTVDEVPDDKAQQEIISITGIAEQRKGGTAIRGKECYVWIENLSFWPEGVAGKLVTATGAISARHDLPVFIADTPEERGRLQGIPVPSGTDLREASKRLVMSKAKWEVLGLKKK